MPEIVILKNSIAKLQFHNIWPGKTKRAKELYFLHLLIAYVTWAPVWIGSGAHFIVSTINHVPEVDVVEDILTTASAIGVIYLVSCFVYQRKHLDKVLQELSDFKIFGKPDDFDKRCKRIDFYSLMFYSYYTGGIAMFGLMALSEISECKRINREYNLKEVCGLFLSANYFFEMDYFPVKQIVFIVQMYSSYMMIGAGGWVSFTSFEVAEHIVLRIEHLKRLLTEAFNGNDKQLMRKRVTNCIAYHIFILRISETFNNCYKNSLFAHLLVTAIVLGCAFYRVQDAGYQAGIHGAGWLVTLFIVCHGGQKLMDESLSIPLAAYKSNWYQGDVNTQKMLVPLMLRAQKPLTVDAAKFGVMGYPLYIAILKTSYTYLTLLDQTSESK